MTRLGTRGRRALAACAMLAVAGCVTPSGQRIPGVARNAEATTAIYLACENIRVLPEDVRESGLIYVDDAFYGYTTRPVLRRALGNSLIVGDVRVEKNRTHVLKVVFRGYEPVVTKKFFGNLQEYVVPFRLTPLRPKPIPPEGG